MAETTMNLLADIGKTLQAQAATMEVLAKALLEFSKQPGQEHFVVEKPFEEVKPEPEPKAEPDAKPEIKFEDLRKLCAGLSAAGKTADVKALIQEAGAARLSEIPEDKWSEVYEKAKALKGAG